MRTLRDIAVIEAMSDEEALKVFYKNYPTSTLLSITTTPYYGSEVIGYTMSDGYALCCKHAKYGQLRDTGNETGFCYPIFDTDESFDCCCDICLEVISEEWHDETEQETEDDDSDIVDGSLAEIIDTAIAEKVTNELATGSLIPLAKIIVIESPKNEIGE